MARDDSPPDGYAVCPQCGEFFSLEVGVCEDCMLQPTKAEEAFEEVGWLTLTLARREEVHRKLAALLADAEAAGNHYCPQCISEYRRDAETCADCGTPLVSLARLVEMYEPKNLGAPADTWACPRCGEPRPEGSEVCEDCLVRDSADGDDSELASVRERLRALVDQSAREDVLVCPMCAVEHRLGFTTCADCQVRLVTPKELLAFYRAVSSGWSPAADKEGVHWVEVAACADEADALHRTKILEEAGIRSRISLMMAPAGAAKEPRFLLYVAEEDRETVGGIAEW